MKNYTIRTLLMLPFAILFASLSTAHADVYIDEMGRRVTIPSRPERIISLAPNITEILFALDLGEEIVGVTMFSDYPEAAGSKPKVGSFVNVSLEKVASLNPDLIIGTADGNRKETVEQLEQIGFPVYVINPGSFKGILETTLNIGTITGREKQAKEVVSGLRQRINAVVSLTENLKRPRVFFQVGINPVVTVGRNTIHNKLIELAGGVNIYGDVMTRYPRCGMEEVVARKPDIIIVSSMKRGGNFPRIKNKWMKWKNIPAVKNDRIYIIESNLIDHSSPRIVDGLEKFVEIIHPEVKNQGVQPHRISRKD
ncbi:MAG: cobalamin-binding protein [Thermodesulfobacteriota bacterium]|nr:cobalamin-binding protein [Thermodesulfobacteriota bacterium]